MVLGATACLGFWWTAWRSPLPSDAATWWTAGVLAGLAIAAQHFPLMVSPRYKVDASVAVYFAALLRLGAPAALVLVLVSHLVGQATLILRRHPVNGVRLRTPRSVLFNTSQFVLATGLGGAAYYAFLPQRAPAPLDQLENLWAVPAAGVAVYLANTLAVAVMVGLQRSQSPVTVWVTGHRADAPQFAGLLLIGLVGALTAAQYPWAPLAMALPAALLHRSLQETMRVLARERDARAEAEAATERVRRLQATIERDWAPLAAVLSGMSDGVVVLDAARRVRYCNARAGELLGADPEAIVGQPDAALTDRLGPHLADAAAARATWDRVVASPRAHPSGELILLRGGGRGRRVVLVSAFPVADAARDRLGLLLRDVTDAKVRAILEERERIAMDLHDGVIQSLYSVVLELGARERLTGADQAPVRTTVRQEIAKLNRIIYEIRNYIYDLRPQDGSASGLRVGLAALAEELRVNALLHARLAVDPEAAATLDGAAEAALLHVAREATSNIVRHASARAVTIGLALADNQVVLTIHDDGRGFASRDGYQLAGHGLRNMAERARALGGRLLVHSEPGNGAEIRLELPLRKERSEHDHVVSEAAAGG